MGGTSEEDKVNVVNNITVTNAKPAVAPAPTIIRVPGATRTETKVVHHHRNRSDKGKTNVVQNVVVQQSQTQTGTSWLPSQAVAGLGILGYLLWPQGNPPGDKTCVVEPKVCPDGTVGEPLRVHTGHKDDCPTYEWDTSDLYCKPKQDCTNVKPLKPSCEKGYEYEVDPTLTTGLGADGCNTYEWSTPVCKKTCPAMVEPLKPSCEKGYEYEVDPTLDTVNDADGCPAYKWTEPVCKKPVVCPLKPAKPPCPTGYEGDPIIKDMGKDKDGCTIWKPDTSMCTPKVPKVDCKGEWENVCKCKGKEYSKNWNEDERKKYDKKEKWVITPAEGTGSTTTCQRPVAEAGKVIVDGFKYTLKDTPTDTVSNADNGSDLEFDGDSDWKTALYGTV